MADEAHEHISVAAAPTRLFELATVYERYPDWARDVKQVDVLERDGDGRGSRVEYRVAGLGKSIRYVLEYDYAEAPAALIHEDLRAVVALGGGHEAVDQQQELVPARIHVVAGAARHGVAEPSERQPDHLDAAPPAPFARRQRDGLGVQPPWPADQHPGLLRQRCPAGQCERHHRS